MRWEWSNLGTYQTMVWILFLLSVGTNAIIRDGDHKQTVCDNAKFNIQEDILSNDGLCKDDLIILKQYYQPAGESYCTDEANTVEGQPLCMNEEIKYEQSIPSSGNYRPLAPKYGEYYYLPPQRWMHALKYGGVVFLYHPCAPLDQVMLLKKLARSCLRKHIITPYYQLNSSEPFALITWGCVYLMSWVDMEPSTRWIQDHALHTTESAVYQDGLYDYGIKEEAEVVSTLDDSVICPSEDTGSTTSVQPSSSPNTSSTQSIDPGIVDTESNDTTNFHNDNCSRQSNDSSDSRTCEVDKSSIVVILIHHHPAVIAIFAIAMILLLGLMCIFLWTFCCRKETATCNRTKKRPLGRYKPCGNFYRGSDKLVGIAIPEFGVPKTVPSEREKLLLDSDEDQL